MKIYVLTVGHYEDKITLGIFDSLELATEAKTRYDDYLKEKWERNRHLFPSWAKFADDLADIDDSYELNHFYFKE
jgi:hypothetical protein